MGDQIWAGVRERVRVLAGEPVQCLHLRPEMQCYPLWTALDDWRERWDATYDLDDPRDPGFASPEEERRFQEDGGGVGRQTPGGAGPAVVGHSARSRQ